jgi:hypothetical protein
MARGNGRGYKQCIAIGLPLDCLFCPRDQCPSGYPYSSASIPLLVRVNYRRRNGEDATFLHRLPFALALSLTFRLRHSEHRTQLCAKVPTVPASDRTDARHSPACSPPPRACARSSPASGRPIGDATSHDRVPIGRLRPLCGAKRRCNHEHDRLVTLWNVCHLDRSVTCNVL